MLIYTDNINFNCSISDAFCWRTDNNFKTIFNYSDILKIFDLTLDSFIIIQFYLNDGTYLKTIKINKLDYHNSLTIDESFFENNIKGYGTFYIHHYSKEYKSIENTIFSNRCYLGYSYESNLYSFVHGNTYASIKRIDQKVIEKNNEIISTSMFMIYKYAIQKDFKHIDKVEFMFANPTDRKVIFSLNNKKYLLKKNQSLILEHEKSNKIVIKSNCSFLRPLAFNYKNQFIDVHHC